MVPEEARYTSAYHRIQGLQQRDRSRPTLTAGAISHQKRLLRCLPTVGCAS